MVSEFPARLYDTNSLTQSTPSVLSQIFTASNQPYVYPFWFTLPNQHNIINMNQESIKNFFVEFAGASAVPFSPFNATWPNVEPWVLGILI